MKFLRKISVESSLQYLKNPVAICFLVNLLVIAIILLFRSILPPVVPLFYGQPQGDDQLASQTLLTLPPIIAIVFTIINLLLAKTVKDAFLRNVLVALTVICTILSTITVIKVIFLVGNL